jgi:hypothetical protein
VAEASQRAGGRGAAAPTTGSMLLLSRPARPHGIGQSGRGDPSRKRSVFRPKVRVKVVVVDERIAVARTYETRQVKVGGQGTTLSSLLTGMKATRYAAEAPPKWIRVPETFKADEAVWRT